MIALNTSLERMAFHDKGVVVINPVTRKESLRGQKIASAPAGGVGGLPQKILKIYMRFLAFWRIVLVIITY